MAANTNKGFGLLFEMGCGKTRTAIAIAGAAYETAVTGSTKVREKDGISESELNALFKEKARSRESW